MVKHKMEKEELLNKIFNKQRNITIKLTWYFAFYIIFLICVWYFLFKAILNTYSPALAGFVFVLTVLSYSMSIFLIRRDEA